jgi:hypothetical protein
LQYLSCPVARGRKKHSARKANNSTHTHASFRLGLEARTCAEDNSAAAAAATTTTATTAGQATWGCSSLTSCPWGRPSGEGIDIPGGTPCRRTVRRTGSACRASCTLGTRRRRSLWRAAGWGRGGGGDEGRSIETGKTLQLRFRGRSSEKKSCSRPPPFCFVLRNKMRALKRMVRHTAQGHKVRHIQHWIVHVRDLLRGGASLPLLRAIHSSCMAPQPK